MTTQEIKGIIVPILTPMNEDETVNHEELVRQIERLIDLLSSEEAIGTVH